MKQVLPRLTNPHRPPALLTMSRSLAFSCSSHSSSLGHEPSSFYENSINPPLTTNVPFTKHASAGADCETAKLRIVTTY